MSRPTAMLVDDEPQLVAQLRTELVAHWPELDVVAEAGDGPSALAAFEERKPDLVFLDIQMPGMTGIEVARRLVGRCHVVFVTAYDQYALQAFDNAAVDYLLKPVDGERLARTVERLRPRLGQIPPDLSTLLEPLAERLRPKAGYLQWLKVQHHRDVVLVPVDDVAVFQASDKYTLAITRDQEWIIRTPLKELEEQLDPARFWRVHRNAIVRVGAIAHVRHDETGRAIVHLRDLTLTIPVSRTYASCFKQM